MTVDIAKKSRIILVTSDGTIKDYNDLYSRILFDGIIIQFDHFREQVLCKTQHVFLRYSLTLTKNVKRAPSIMVILRKIF